MTPDSLLIGIGSALIGAAGLWNRDWLLTETPKGRFVVEMAGAGRARFIISLFFLFLMGAGILLAGGWLQPIRW
jgi:hypothetical protein